MMDSPTITPPVEPTLEELWQVLHSVPDPEIPVISVVDLGIVRGLELVDGGAVVTVTPTYSGCPAMEVIERDIAAALESRLDGPVTVRRVYSPPWTTDWMSDDARARLKEYGIAPPGAVVRDDGSDLVQLRRHRAAPPCPFCDSPDTEPRSDFGSTACKSLAFCLSCQQPFELFKPI